MRELDLQVHEHVLGLCPHLKTTKWTIEDGNDYDWGYTCDACGSDSHRVPNYSEDIAAAWPLVEKFRLIVGHVFDNPTSNLWTAYDGAKKVVANGYTAPEAICRAAVLMVGGNPVTPLVEVKQVVD